MSGLKKKHSYANTQTHTTIRPCPLSPSQAPDLQPRSRRPAHSTPAPWGKRGRVGFLRRFRPLAPEPSVAAIYRLKRGVINYVVALGNTVRGSGMPQPAVAGFRNSRWRGFSK